MMHEDEASKTKTATETATLEHKMEASQGNSAINKVFHYVALEMKNESGKLSATEEEELSRLRTKGMADAKKALTHYVKGWNDFSGKSGRLEFWWSIIIVNAIGLCLGWISKPLGWVWLLSTVWPTLAIYVRRLNDIDKSWKSLFWFFVPFVGPILILIWVTRKGNTAQTEEAPSAAKVSEDSTCVSAISEETAEPSEESVEKTSEEPSEPKDLPSETPETPSPEKRTCQYTEYDDPITNWLSQNVVKDRDITDLFRWVMRKVKPESNPTRNDKN